MKQEKKNIHLALSFDENYVTPFYVLLTSVFANNPNNNIVFHAIATGLMDEQKQEIKDFIEKNSSTINFYELDVNNLEGLVIPKGTWFSIAAYYRLFFASLVGDDVEKLLYIDTDTVVIGDLSELYFLDIGDKPVGAVREKLGHPRPEIGNTDRENYFNSGVMLINIPEWRKQTVTERALQFVHDYPEAIKCVDQDALNAVLINNWFRIHGRFNVLYQDIPMNLGRSSYSKYLREKVIIHYTLGEHKPWRALGDNRFRYLYHGYLRQSPRSYEKKYQDFRMSAPFLYKYSRVRVVEFARNYPKMLVMLATIKQIAAAFIEL
jgi:lipopolysaccharide biosynthesis glycosyltransferase